MKLAQESITSLLRDWESANPIAKGALHTACVIAYARPFVSAQTRKGKVKYPKKELKNTHGFDGELHDHILDLRNRLIAHSDYAVFPSTMYFQTVGDEQLPVTLGINVKGMIGIEARSLAERYARHLQVCATVIEKALNHECNDLVEKARLYPSELAKTHNIPPVTQEYNLGTDNAVIPRPSGPSASVENPPFPEGLSAYHYVMLTHQIPLIESGKYTVTRQGAAIEITFTVDR